MSIARLGVDRPVPVNLVMMAILLCGVVSVPLLRREFYPTTELDQAEIIVKYPGATPREVEQGVAIKIEDKLAELDEIEEIRTTLSDGGGRIVVQFKESVESAYAFREVERVIDSITDLPEEVEQIQSRLFEPKIPVIRVTVFGDLDERVIKRAIRGVQDDLRSLPKMGEIVVGGVRDYEVRVDVSSEAVLRYGISLPQVADAIRSWMADVPGGTIHSRASDIRVRTLGVGEQATSIRQIPVRADAAGGIVTVADIAQVKESFVDDRIINRYDGQRAASLTVYKAGEQDIVYIAECVRAYVEGRNGIPVTAGLFDRFMKSHRDAAWQVGKSSRYPLPTQAKIVCNSDFSRYVEDRLDLMVRNAKYGAVLVFLLLLMSLSWRVAWWVGVGLVMALMGTFVMMAWLGVTLNLMTMFGLIIVLGMLVDDAIVVSENIQTRNDRGEPPLDAAIGGTQQVLWPVVATVLTTVVAFVPLIFIRGRVGSLLGALPAVVSCALLVSLMESLFMLPSHMGHSLARRSQKPRGRWRQMGHRAAQWRDRLFLERVQPLYKRVLAYLLENRYATVSVATAILIATIGLVQGGHIRYTFMPKSDAEGVVIDVRVPTGTPIEETDRVIARIERAVRAQDETQSISTAVGQHMDVFTGVLDAPVTHVGQMYVELKPVDQRNRSSSQIIAGIRHLLAGQLDGVDRVVFNPIHSGFDEPDISIQVRGLDLGQIRQAAEQMKHALAGFQGVRDIADDQEYGQAEVRVIPHQAAASLGISTDELARQVRGFLHGLDAHVFADQREDIAVRVRLDEQARDGLTAIEEGWIILPDGRPVPVSEFTSIKRGTAYATIKRVDRERAVTLTANTTLHVNPEAVTAQFPLHQFRERYPGLRIEYVGRQKQQREAFTSLPAGVITAIASIYFILAWLFSRYIQPLVVLVVVPFSIIGVVWGHLLLGYDITFLSVIGFVALTGIVVNDSLILVTFYNQEREQGKSVFESLLDAGQSRLRAILLTTVTTVAGLTPLLLERSFQARFLIPMAISIAIGLIAATVIVLTVLPCFILLLSDLRGGVYSLWLGKSGLLSNQRLRH